MTSITPHAVVDHTKWLEARNELLVKEKELSRLQDKLAKQRREMPWEEVTKDYVFEGPSGKETLAELFGTNSQLIVYHFMFPPEDDAGCAHCSTAADNFNGMDVHIAQRDVTFIVVSRAPIDKINAYKKRMGWSFKWVSTDGNTFNYDHYASFTPEEIAQGKTFVNYRTTPSYGQDEGAASVFFKDGQGNIFHTYSTYRRGLDNFGSAYNMLDLTPKGRNEDQLSSPQDWVRRHDEYSKQV